MLQESDTRYHGNFEAISPICFWGWSGSHSGNGGAGEGEFQADDITGEKALLLIQGSKNSPGDLEGMSVM